jgi:hypothetical protein
MKDHDLLQRLPYHAPARTPQISRLLKNRQVLGVITRGEEGINLYPHNGTVSISL